MRANENMGSMELAALSAEFDASELAGQFVVGPVVDVRPQGWRATELSGWTLVHAPDLPVTSISDRSGVHIGWILGHPLRLHEGPLTGDLQIDADLASSGFCETFERALYAHAGPFAAILVRPAPRVYLDAYGALPLHYDRARRLASSSPFLLSGSGDVRESETAAALDVVRTNLWHILGTSPLAGAARLVPNHALDLETWRPQRIWPRVAPEPTSLDEALEDAADAISGSIAAASATSAASISITGGGDTRLLLACSRDLVDRLRFFTVAIPDVLGEIDRLTAPVLARRFELSHRLLPWVSPEQRDIHLWLYRTGLTDGERRGRAAGPTYAQLEAGLPYISGVGGALGVGGADFGVDTAGAMKNPSGAELVRAFHFPLLDAFVQAAEQWLAGLPEGLDAVQVHTLFRFEMYYGCWGGPLALGYPEAARYTLYPNGQRRVLDAAMRLPLDNRIRGDAGVEAIRRIWPELLEVPINQPTLRLRVRRQTVRSVDVARAGFRRLARLAAS